MWQRRLRKRNWFQASFWKSEKKGLQTLTQNFENLPQEDYNSGPAK